MDNEPIKKKIDLEVEVTPNNRCKPLSEMGSFSQNDRRMAYLSEGLCRRIYLPFVCGCYVVYDAR